MQSTGKSRAPIHCIPRPSCTEQAALWVVLGPRWWLGLLPRIPQPGTPGAARILASQAETRIAVWGALLSLRKGAGGCAQTCNPRRAPLHPPPGAPVPPTRRPLLHWSGGCASGGPRGDPDLRQKTVRTASCPSGPPFPLCLFSGSIHPKSFSPLLSPPRGVNLPGLTETVA